MGAAQPFAFLAAGLSKTNAVAAERVAHACNPCADFYADNAVSTVM